MSMGGHIELIYTNYTSACVWLLNKELSMPEMRKPKESVLPWNVSSKYVLFFLTWIIQISISSLAIERIYSYIFPKAISAKEIQNTTMGNVPCI